MTTLITTPNVLRPDEVYARLIAMHDGLSDAECRRADARLILLLLNHIGDEQVIFEAIELARRQRRREPPPDSTA